MRLVVYQCRHPERGATTAVHCEPCPFYQAAPGRESIPTIAPPAAIGPTGCGCGPKP